MGFVIGAIMVLVVLAASTFAVWRWLNSSGGNSPALRAAGPTYRTTSPTWAASATHSAPGSEGGSMFDLETETERIRREMDAQMPALLRQMEADAAALIPEMEAEAARLHAETIREEQTDDWLKDEPSAAVRWHEQDAENLPQRHERPSWMKPEDWDYRVTRYREQGRTERVIAETSAYLEQRGPRRQRTRTEGEQRRVIWREDYVPKEDEARYLTREADGLPTLRLADAGDRLGIWSPLDGGALINPKGAGLRQRLGLCTSYARGSKHNAHAYRAADLTYGRWVELKREPDNPHDGNAVAICAQDTGARVGYVGRGRAASVARRMDAGEDMAGVTIWGPGRGEDDRSTLVLIGSRADLAAMLDG